MYAWLTVACFGNLGNVGVGHDVEPGLGEERQKENRVL